MMMRRSMIMDFALVALGILLFSVIVEAQRTKVGFYSANYPKAESIVRSTVQTYFNVDHTIAAGLLRLSFHDCFVQGCDGSILITGPSVERNSLTNLGLLGFEVIEDVKEQVEAVCPGVVSCADILALASRDVVVLSNGPTWSVPTGRRDGLVSSSSDTSNLPIPADSITVQKKKFADKGLTTKDLVILVEAHTTGQSDCQFFHYRLYNFIATGNADPTISSSYLTQLQSLCPAGGDGSKRVALDKGSQMYFDLSFFKNVRDGNGVLESDQRLWSIDHLQILEDSRVIIDWISHKSLLRSVNIEGWKDKIQSLSNRFLDISYRHISRSFNKEADALSKRALGGEVGRLSIFHCENGSESIITHINLFEGGGRAI